MAKQVFDLREGKGMSAGQSTEHLRNYSVMNPEEKKYGYYDPTRVNLNFEVGKGGVIMPVRKQYSIVQRFKDNLRNRGIEDPNEKKIKAGKEPNRNTVANIIIGGSREQMHRLAFGEQTVNLEKGADNRNITRKEDIEKWALDMYDFVSKKFGEENIVAFIVHLDEKNPHIHCTLVPVNKKGKISYHDVFGHSKNECRDTFKKLHDEVAERNEKWGLERGTDINTTGARHRTSEEYWQELKNKCQELENKAAEKGNEIEGKEKQIELLNKEIYRATIKSKGLSKMIENLASRKDDILGELNELEEKARDAVLEGMEYEEKKKVLENELKTVEEKLKNKKEMLHETEEKLEELADIKGRFKKEIRQMNEQLNNDKPQVEKRVLRDMESLAWKQAVAESKVFTEDMKKIVNVMPEEQQKTYNEIHERLIEGSMLDDMANRGHEVAAVATALFLGYIDKATDFAQAHGGGGGGSGDWSGKQPDEDDKAFMNRCLQSARMMMRPAGARKGIRKKR